MYCKRCSLDGTLSFFLRIKYCKLKIKSLLCDSDFAARLAQSVDQRTAERKAAGSKNNL